MRIRYEKIAGNDSEMALALLEPATVYNRHLAEAS
jgi:hypothetical protein